MQKKVVSQQGASGATGSKFFREIYNRPASTLLNPARDSCPLQPCATAVHGFAECESVCRHVDSWAGCCGWGSGIADKRRQDFPDVGACADPCCPEGSPITGVGIEFRLQGEKEEEPRPKFLYNSR